MILPQPCTWPFPAGTTGGQHWAPAHPSCALGSESEGKGDSTVPQHLLKGSPWVLRGHHLLLWVTQEGQKAEALFLDPEKWEGKGGDLKRGWSLL
jgi:hypothetical protein